MTLSWCGLMYYGGGRKLYAGFSVRRKLVIGNGNNKF